MRLRQRRNISHKDNNMAEFCEAIKKDNERCMCKTKHYSPQHAQWRCERHLSMTDKFLSKMIDTNIEIPKMTDQELINLTKPHPNKRNGVHWDSYQKDAWEELEKRFLKTGS